MDPRRHDELLAFTSHLTHAMAFSLTRAGAGARIVPRSFLEATRVAKSDPTLWDDIFLTNRREIARAIDRLTRELGTLRRLLTRSNRAGLLKFLAQAQRLRHGLD